MYFGWKQCNRHPNEKARYSAEDHFEKKLVMGAIERGGNVELHFNPVESLWSMFKGGFVGTYSRMSFKHLHRYVNEFAGRKNIRELNILEQMREIVRGMEHRRLCFCDLVA